MSASVCESPRGPALALAVLACLACACGDPASYRFGTNLSGLRFKPVTGKEGIHPDLTVLIDPNNPFRFHPVEILNADGTPLAVDIRWRLLSDGVSVAAFYAFATQLTRVPIGENQFYAAQMLDQISRTGAVAEGVEPSTVRDMAIAGYQSMLDNFPDARSFDSTGTTSFRLSTPAVQAIIALGGRPQNDWLLVETPQGVQAVKGSGGP